MRAAALNDPGNSWHLGHMEFPTAWGQASDGFVYVTALPAEPPDPMYPKSDESGSPLHRIVLAPGSDDDDG